MGWILVVECYFSLSLIGLLIGFFYPALLVFVLNRKNNQDPSVLALRRPIPLLCASVISSVRFGFYTFILLVALAFVASICFGTWAVISGLGT